MHSKIIFLCLWTPTNPHQDLCHRWLWWHLLRLCILQWLCWG
ncbi:hypothetical protein CsSME_00017421 [Camellia sinensis var. sinensis]